MADPQMTPIPPWAPCKRPLGCDYPNCKCHSQTTIPAPGKLNWGVREEGNKVVIEFTCHDAYEAIELAEVCAKGLEDGELTIEVGDAESV